MVTSLNFCVTFNSPFCAYLVLPDNVRGYGPRLVHAEVSVNHEGDVVHGVQLQNQMGFFKIAVSTKLRGNHLFEPIAEVVAHLHVLELVGGARRLRRQGGDAVGSRQRVTVDLDYHLEAAQL